MKQYEDLLKEERPAPVRQPMAVEHRAKQFAPFAALRGFEQSIDERGVMHEVSVQNEIERCMREKNEISGL